MKNPLRSTLVMLTGIALLAACNQQKEQKDQCHLGQNFTDSTFHNLGIG